MACLGCGRGFHEECDSNCINCHGESDRLVKTFIGSRGVGQPIKDPENVKDRHSTGRKRAAHLYPIFKDKPCEWQGKKNCGGGTPIVGCIDRLQVDRHHGPVKDTLRNEPGNVHRICKNCVHPDTRILTENLEWVPAKQLVVGDRLIGFTEKHIPLKRSSHQVYGARDTVFEPAIIESIERISKPSYKLIMQNGTELISSNDHLWVGSSSNDNHILWRRTDKIKRFDYINHLVDPWVSDETWFSGWLAGYIDGEGCLSGYQLSIAQKEGFISDLSSELLNGLIKGKLHYTYRPKKESHHQNAEVFRITNLPDIMRVLGTVRPYRLLEQFPNFLWGKYPLLGKASRKVRVESVEFIGEQEVCSIQTSSKTFVAEGFLSHNCHNRWHAVNDPIYDEELYNTLPHKPEPAEEMELLANEAYWKLKK